MARMAELTEAHMIIAHTMRAALEATIDDAMMNTVQAAHSAGLSQDTAAAILMGALASSMVAMSSARVASANGITINDQDDNAASYEGMTVEQVHNANRLCMQSLILAFRLLVPKQMDVIMSASIRLSGGSEMVGVTMQRLNEELKDGNV